MCDRRETVGDDESGSPVHQLFERILDERLRFGVQVRGGLVEYKYTGIGQNSSGNGYALALSPGQACAALADACLVAIGEVHDEVVSVSGDGSLDHLFVAGLRPAVFNIVAQAAGKQEAFLHNHTDVLAQTAQRHIAHVMTINQHLTGGGVVEAWYQVDKCGLAAAGGPHQGHYLARLSLQVDVAQHHFCGLVGEIEIPHLDMAFYSAQLLRLVRLLDARYAVESFEDPLDGCHGPVN